MILSLQQLGFKVRNLRNFTKEDFTKSFDFFLSELQQNKIETALFYYAGHGCLHNQTQYIQPNGIITPKTNTFDIEKCISINDIIGELNKIQSLKTKIIILDSCSRETLKSTTPSSSFVDGSAVIFGTLPGCAALANTGGLNNAFTQCLLPYINQDIPLSEIVSKTNIDLETLTKENQHCLGYIPSEQDVILSKLLTQKQKDLLNKNNLLLSIEKQQLLLKIMAAKFDYRNIDKSIFNEILQKY